MLKTLLDRRQKLAASPSANPTAAVRGWNEDEARLLQSIWKHTTLPKAEFDLTYGALFRNTWNYLDHAPRDGWPDSPFGDVRRSTLILANTALRVRQARIIPRGMPAEDAARLAEVMTFAVAICSVLEQIGNLVSRLELDTEDRRAWCPYLETAPPTAERIGERAPVAGYGLLLLSSFVSEEGQRWLAQEPEAMRAILRCFTEPRTSEVHAIVQHAKRTAFPDVQLPRVPEQQSALDALLGPALPTQPTQPTQTPPEAPSSEKPAEGLATQQRPSTGHQKPSQPPQAAQSAPTGKPVAKGWHYVTWLRDALASHTVELNTNDGFVHVLPGDEVFLVVPDAFERYAIATDAPAKRTQNQVARLLSLIHI